MIERAVVLGKDSATIARTDLQLSSGSTQENPPPPIVLEEAVERFRRERIQKVLAECGGNKTKAARVLGLSRSHFSELVKKMGVK